MSGSPALLRFPFVSRGGRSRNLVAFSVARESVLHKGGASGCARVRLSGFWWRFVVAARCATLAALCFFVLRAERFEGVFAHPAGGGGTGWGLMLWGESSFANLVGSNGGHD